MQHNMLPRDDILGTIRIDVYQAQLGKSSTAYPYTFFPDLHAHRADDLRVS